ncbi:MAG TPA: acyltransferase [Novosphingobium sp.]|nr:acyltransferase [Novosphingobium sp.]
MGRLRVLLALSVVFWHTGGLRGYAMIGGPLAVQCFFIVSGFYMGLVLNERYDRPALNRAFYANRAIRIYGTYFLFLALTLAVFAAVQLRDGYSPLWPYLTETVSLPEKALLALLNLTVVGQDLPYWLGIADGHLYWSAEAMRHSEPDVYHFMAIPVAWSLSLELCFYALAPYIARRPVWQIVALCGASLLARIVAAWIGYDADPWSYRFFPFELALFLAGVLAYRAFAAWRGSWTGIPARVLALAVPAAILAYPFVAGDVPDDQFFAPARLALLALLAFALPAIHTWSQHSRTDRAIGELSYPLYLGHLLVLGLIGGISPLAGNSIVRTIGVSAVSLALAWLMVRFLDVRIEAYRRGIAAKAGAST